MPAETPASETPQTIKIGDKEMPVAEVATTLADLQAKVAASEKFNANAQKLLDKTLTPEARKDITLSMLKDMGVSDAEAARMVEDAQEPEAAEEEAEEEAPPKPSRDELKEVRDRLERQEETQVRIQMDRVTSKIETAMNEAVDKNSDVRTFLEKLVDHHKENFEPIRDQLVREIQSETIRALNERRVRSKSAFNEDWIAEVTPKVVQQVVGKYRTVIGDLNRIGKSSETDGGVFESLKSSKPKPTPTFKGGKSRATIEHEAGEWSTDMLSRLAAEMSLEDSSSRI